MELEDYNSYQWLSFFRKAESEENANTILLLHRGQVSGRPVWAISSSGSSSGVMSQHGSTLLGLGNDRCHRKRPNARSVLERAPSRLLERVFFN